ncbi:hypothetical protein PTKIN_Ptkin03bG0102000 [Pterospermum kingtungense]
MLRKEVTLREERRESGGSYGWLRLALRVKYFIWRLIHNLTPKVLALESRGMDIDTSCRVSGEVEESWFYMLFECRLAMQTWRLAMSRLWEVIEEIPKDSSFWD